MANRAPTQTSPTIAGMALTFRRRGGGRLLRLGGEVCHPPRSSRAPALRRTPRPPPWLAAPSPINSIPAWSIAPINFMRQFDIASNDALAGLHPLDRRNREVRQLGQTALVDPEQGAGRPQLRCRQHRSAFGYRICLVVWIYIMELYV